jgi:hypothetical protein
MKFPNKSRHLLFLGLVSLLLWPTLGSAQSADQPTEVGYVSLTTVQQSPKEGEADSFAPSLLVRFTHTDGPGRIFAMTDRGGTAVVPLEPGNYCAAAYGLDGKPVALSARSMEPIHRCFSVKAGTTIEFSVTLAPGVKYVRSIPPLGVSEVLPDHESGHVLAAVHQYDEGSRSNRDASYSSTMQLAHLR